jgi:hypothetical protein
MKVWTDKPKCEKQLKKPMIALRGQSLIVVDPETGDKIHPLVFFGNDVRKFHAYSDAERIIREAGYSTNWAQWNNRGGFDGMLEDFE